MENEYIENKWKFYEIKREVFFNMNSWNVRVNKAEKYEWDSS